MTKEEVHDLMEDELRCAQRANYCDIDCAKCPLAKEDKELIEAYGYVIKALEQESILDKTRAEIEEYQKDAFYSNDVMMPKKMVLAIIDKYKAEQEGA